MKNAILAFHSNFEPEHEATITDAGSLPIRECPSVSCAFESGGRIFIRHCTLSVGEGDGGEVLSGAK